MAGPVQLLSARSRVGPPVRPRLPLFSVFSTGMSESAPLARQPLARRGHRVSAMWQRLPHLRGSPRLQQLADSLTTRDLERCARKWVRALVPFFTPTERRVCEHRLFVAQVEYCESVPRNRL